MTRLSETTINLYINIFYIVLCEVLTTFYMKLKSNLSQMVTKRLSELDSMWISLFVLNATWNLEWFIQIECYCTKTSYQTNLILEYFRSINLHQIKKFKCIYDDKFVGDSWHFESKKYIFKLKTVSVTKQESMNTTG